MATFNICSDVALVTIMLGPHTETVLFVLKLPSCWFKDDFEAALFLLGVLLHSIPTVIQQ